MDGILGQKKLENLSLLLFLPRKVNHTHTLTFVRPAEALRNPVSLGVQQLLRNICERHFAFKTKLWCLNFCESLLSNLKHQIVLTQKVFLHNAIHKMTRQNAAKQISKKTADKLNGISCSFFN